MAENEEKDEVLEDEEDSGTSEKPKKEKAVKKADGSKPVKKKFGLFEKIAKFLRDYRSELKKIVWYGRNATIKSTILVICVIVIAAAVIGTLDFIFSNILLSLGRLI